jgi:hypothetical protein
MLEIIAKNSKYLYIVFILTGILFYYVVASGGTEKGIIVILCSILLSPLILYLYSKTNKNNSVLGMLAPYILSGISSFISVILTIIMAIYIYLNRSKITNVNI